MTFQLSMMNRGSATLSVSPPASLQTPTGRAEATLSLL